MKAESLKGSIILVTRPVAQAMPLALLIEQQGGQAFLCPTLEIVPLPPPLDSIKIQNYQWFIFTSTNAVIYLPKADQQALLRLQPKKIAAIGKATAKALKKIGIEVDLIPSKPFNSEALLAFPALQSNTINHKNILIFRGQGGRALLGNTLRQRGAKIHYRDVYKRIQPVTDTIALLIEHLKQTKISQITMTSGEALTNFVSMLETPQNIAFALEIPLVVISQRVKTIAITLGFKKIFISESPADSAMIKTVITICNGENCDRKNS
jgi:uroporphyrinogen-III synthase